MKKTVTFVIALFLTIALPAQIEHVEALLSKASTGKVEKSTTTVTWYLNDSIVNENYDAASSAWVFNEATKIDYNGKNWVKKTFWQLQSGVPVANYVILRVLNDKELTAEQIYKTFDSNTNSIENSSRDTFVYDSDNRLIERYSFSWNGSSWVYTGKNKWVYGSQGNVDTMYLYTYDNVTNTWLYSYRTIYAYDNNNNLLAENVESYGNGAWQPSNAILYTYDQNNRKIEETSKVYDPNQGALVNSSKTLYTYYTDGMTKAEVNLTWDSNNSAWKNTDSVYFEYNQGALSKEEDYSWDATNNQWNKETLVNITFDANNKPTEALIQSWDSQNNVWVSSFKYLFSSYAADLDKTILEENMLANLLLFVPGEIIIQGYNPVTNQWENVKRDRYFYKQFVETITAAGILNNRIKIYPNPASEYVMFGEEIKQGSFVSIYDMSGKKVIHKALYSNMLSVRDLQLGIYSVVVEESGKIYQGKFIKR